MNLTELYQFAYKLHYTSKNYAEAYKIYNKIVDDFQNTKEAKYARSQMENIKRLNIELDDSPIESKEVNEYLLEQKREKENKEDKKDTTKNETDVKKIKLSTTNNIDGYIVDKYIDIISSQIVLGTGIVSEFSAGISDFFGARSVEFENKLLKLRMSALIEIKKIALQKDGNAVIGVHFDYTTFSNNILGLVVTGTVVSIKEKTQIENIPTLLEALYELKNKQIVSEEEYEQKRKILLNKIK